MSTTTGISTTFPFPTALGTLPPEGSKVAAVAINWPIVLAGGGGYTAVINLLQQYQSGQFVTVQSVYVDNSTNIFPVSIVCAESQQNLTVAPFSQAMLPLISSVASQYTVTLNVVPYPAGNTLPLGSTRLHFLNTPQKPFALQEIAGTTNFQTINGNVAGLTQSFQILPALAATQHYAISQFSATILAPAAYSSAQIVTAALQDSGFGFYEWRDSFYVTATMVGVLYSRQTLFPTPSMQFDGGSAINFVLSAYPAGTVQLTYQITYGVVTIQ